MGQDQRRKMQSKVSSVLRKVTSWQNRAPGSPNWCFVPALPTRNMVCGKCLILQLGNSRHFFEVALYNFEHAARDSLDRLPLAHRVFILTPAIRQSEMKYFSDFVTLCIKQLLAENGVSCPLTGQPICMGVAAAFQLIVAAQRFPASAYVVSSNKDFLMTGFIGGDFVADLHSAFKRAGLNIKIVTVLNDSVSVLLGGIYKFCFEPSRDCSIGVLCSKTGSNIAYLESNRDFLDLCSPDGRLLLRRPQSYERCAVVNSEVGNSVSDDNCGLRELANMCEKHVIDELKESFRLECIISAIWYSRILERCLITLLSTGTISRDSMPGGTVWRIDHSKGFNVFTRCDKWFAEQAVSSNTRLDELAFDLRQLLHFACLSNIDASYIANVCKAIVGRTAEVTACTVMAIAEKIYNDAFPRHMGVAFGGSLFSSLSQLQLMLEIELQTMASSKTEVQLIESQPAFGCVVTAASAGFQHDLCTDSDAVPQLP